MEKDYYKWNIEVRNLTFKVEADVSQYKLLWDNNVDTKRINVVGEFHNYDNEQIFVPVVVSEETLRELRMSRLAFVPNYKNYVSDSYIAISDSFYREMVNHPELISLLYHEIGHFHTLQYFKERNMACVRKRYVSEGKIVEEEMAADLFGLLYSSSDEFISALNYVIKIRRLQNIADFELKMMGIRELTSRKKYIKSIEGQDYLSLLYNLCLSGAID